MSQLLWHNDRQLLWYDSQLLWYNNDSQLLKVVCKASMHCCTLKSFFCMVSTLLNLHQQENPARTMLNYSQITGFFIDLTPSLINCKTNEMPTRTVQRVKHGWAKNC